MSKPDSDLDVMIPTPEDVTIGGKTFKLQPMKVRHLKPVLQISKPFVSLFNQPGAVDIPSLIIDHGDSVVALTAVLTDQTEAWVGDLGIDELVALFSKVVEVNLDFFTQKVFPSVSAAMVRLNVVSPGALKGFGPKPSNP